MRAWAPEETVGASASALDRFMRTAQGLTASAPLFLMLRESGLQVFLLARRTDDLADHLEGLTVRSDDPMLAAVGDGAGPTRVPSVGAAGAEDAGRVDLGQRLSRAGVAGLWLVPLGREGSPEAILGVCDPIGRSHGASRLGAAALVALRDLWGGACASTTPLRDGVAAAMASCVADGVLVIDSGGRVTFVNPAARSLLGLDDGGAEEEAMEAAIQRRLDSLRFKDDSNEEFTWLSGPLTWALDPGGIHSLEVREVSRRPERRLRLSGSPILDNGGAASGAVLAVRDLTALSDLRERLEGAVEVERRRSAQLRALNQFAVTVNSEIDPGRILDEVLGTALRLTRSTAGAVYVPSGGELRLEAFVTIPELGEAPHGDATGRMDLKDVALRVAAGPMAVRMAEEVARTDGRFLGYLGVPLVTRGGGLIACVVVVGSPNQIGFTVEDEVLATTLAAHAGVALENLMRLAREREVAYYLQRAMLPREIRVPGLAIDHVYESATDAALVGGDFYDVVPLGGGRVAVMVGDVCGKGLPAATFMSFARHTLKAQAALGLDAGGWLDAVNVILASDPETPSFVTVALAVVDTLDGSAEIALAGHPGPFLVTDEGVVEIDGVHGLPLGVDHAVRYTTSRFHMGSGQTLCLYTDGLIEARRGGEFFGEERLRDALARCFLAGFEGSGRCLVDEVTEFAGQRLVDDVVVLLVRLTEEPSPTRRPRAGG